MTDQHELSTDHGAEAADSSAFPMPATASYRKIVGLIPVDRTNYTDFLQGHAVCEATCTNRSACVGFTADQTPSNCWLYDSVTALVPSAPDAFYLKPGVPEPTHVPVPPPPVPPLLALANASTTSLQVQVLATELPNFALQHSNLSQSSIERETIAFTLTNLGERVALFVRLAMRETLAGPEVPFAVFSNNFVCLLPGESYNVTGIFLVANDERQRQNAAMVCAEAWNAVEVCVS
jgi:hypothetical protein